MFSFGVQKGYQLEGDIRQALNIRAGYEPNTTNESFLLTEEMIKDRFGLCVNSKGKRFIGVDILCNINSDIYAIQCKQRAEVVPKREVQEFIDYVNFLERKIGRKIIKVFSSSEKSTGPGNILGDQNGINWIIYTNSKALIINTVSWIFDKKFCVDNDCDYIM
jgi:hypothetical protein